MLPLQYLHLLAICTSRHKVVLVQLQQEEQLFPLRLVVEEIVLAGQHRI